MLLARLAAAPWQGLPPPLSHVGMEALSLALLLTSAVQGLSLSASWWDLLVGISFEMVKNVLATGCQSWLYP